MGYPHCKNALQPSGCWLMEWVLKLWMIMCQVGGESTVTECLKKFVRAVIEVFKDEYLRRPTAEDVQRLLQMGEARGFPGMIGSIDCMHWEWKNCPAAWKGMFVQGDHDKPTIMAEAVASADLWIWHAFFGVPGSNNDINVLDRSSVFNYILKGDFKGSISQGPIYSERFSAQYRILSKR
ncbi:hypothetical protein SLA2020_122890 [Shorea laevis]